MTRIFESESGNLARDEGKEMAIMLSSERVDFDLLEVKWIRSGKKESEVFWTKPTTPSDSEPSLSPSES